MVIYKNSSPRSRLDFGSVAEESDEDFEVVDDALPEGEINAEVKKLAALPIGVYDTKRIEAAQRLGMSRVSVLDMLVKAERAKTAKVVDDFLPHWKVQPWPDPVNGDALLNELRQYFNRYAVTPKHADIVLALWVLHSWVFDRFDITPYLLVTSPTRRCGKSLVLTILQWLCCRAKKNDSMSKAAIYRSVEVERPTLVLDETSWVIDLKDGRQGILCGGFERNGFVEVCEGESSNITVRRYSTYCPKAFGAIIISSDNGFAVAVNGEIVRAGFVSRGHAAMWAARQKIYERKTPSRRPVEIPANLEDEAIKPIPLLAQMSGDSYPTFLADAKAGRYGALYQLGRRFGLKFGDWKRGMATRVVK